MIDWLNDNEGAALFFTAVASALVAIVALTLTYVLARRANQTSERAQLATELATRAQIGAVLVITSLGTENPGPQGARVSFEVHNIGRAPAEAVEAEFYVGKQRVEQASDPYNPYIAGRGMQGHGSMWQISFGVPGELMKEFENGQWRTAEPWTVRCIYTDALGDHAATYAPDVTRDRRRR